MELDVHLSADGQVYVFHDDVLDRLTEANGPVEGKTFAELQAIAFRKSDEHMPTFRQVLDLVGGRAGLVVELKSYFAERQTDLVRAVADILATYAGPVVVKSFDPRMMEDFASIAPEMPRGIIVDDCGNPDDYNQFRYVDRDTLVGITHVGWSKIQFVSYWVKRLPDDVGRRVREDWKMPLICWTIRNDEDCLTARRYADQIIFENYDPARAPVGGA